MSVRNNLLIFILFYIGTCFAMPLGSKEESLNQGKDPVPVEVVGILRLVGNEPFTRLVVSGEDGKDYFLQPTEPNSLRRFIGSKIRVKGILKIMKIKTADGKELGDELLLNHIVFSSSP